MANADIDKAQAEMEAMRRMIRGLLLPCNSTSEPPRPEPPPTLESLAERVKELEEEVKRLRGSVYSASLNAALYGR